MKYVLLSWWSSLTPIAHFSAVLLATLVATFAVSHLLYRFIEVPGIRLGRSLSRHFSTSRFGTQRTPVDSKRISGISGATITRVVIERE